MSAQNRQAALAPLGREEYIEQVYLFSALGEYLKTNRPTQEILQSVREEILATTKLPLAIDFLLGELKHLGVLAKGMRKLPHYFTAFQAFVVEEAERDRGSFDIRTAYAILQLEAKYRAEKPTHQGLFLYQFEVLCRHRLGYDAGLSAIASDSAFNSAWKPWILTLRRQIGMVEFADLLYIQSEHCKDQRDAPPLFGEHEGRIALANRHKQPMLLFASLHRHLGYPKVPDPPKANIEEQLLPQFARRLELLEKRLRMIEEEQKGGLDLTQFYGPPEE